MSQSLTRRQFVQAAIAPAVLTGPSWGRDRSAPSDRTTVGVIGLGGRGMHLLKEFLQQPACQVVAICDVQAEHYRDNPWGKGQALGTKPALQMIEKEYAKTKAGLPPQGIGAFTDFRELCALTDLDAIVVATPDHWHARIALEGLRQGRDVYCEKPVTHWFAEGQRLVKEIADRKAIVQVGSQQRSSPLFQHAVAVVKSGRLGKLQRVEVGLPDGYGTAQGDATPIVPPTNLNYDLWTGPAESLPYMVARHHRWWRGHRAYGGGTLMDWIGHHLDIAHLGLGCESSGPSRVEAVGWTFPETPVYNTPVAFTIQCQYPGNVELVVSSTINAGTKWIGADGWLWVNRGKLQVSDPTWLKEIDQKPERGESTDKHVADFLASVQSRRPNIAPVSQAHRSITPGHLAFVSQEVGRPLRWDPQTERIIDDPAAQEKLLHTPYRSPWSLG